MEDDHPFDEGDFFLELSGSGAGCLQAFRMRDVTSAEVSTPPSHPAGVATPSSRATCACGDETYEGSLAVPRPPAETAFLYMTTVTAGWRLHEFLLVSGREKREVLLLTVGRARALAAGGNIKTAVGRLTNSGDDTTQPLLQVLAPLRLHFKIPVTRKKTIGRKSKIA
eukprot:scaffold155426_cov18-Prasinocladus_malaysianus.AAC.1